MINTAVGVTDLAGLREMGIERVTGTQARGLWTGAAAEQERRGVVSIVIKSHSITHVYNHKLNNPSCHVLASY